MAAATLGWKQSAKSAFLLSNKIHSVNTVHSCMRAWVLVFQCKRFICIVCVCIFIHFILFAFCSNNTLGGWIQNASVQFQCLHGVWMYKIFYVYILFGAKIYRQHNVKSELEFMWKFTSHPPSPTEPYTVTWNSNIAMDWFLLWQNLKCTVK